MSEPIGPDDEVIDEHAADELLGRLGEALLAADPVPERVLAGARAAFTWRTIDAELAELVFDSATEPTGVRGGVEDTARQVTFQAPGVEIEVMVIDDGSRRIVGQLVPPEPERPVRIGAGSWLGHGTVVLPGAQIGEHVVIGANSVVTGEIPAFTVAVGAPARVVAKIEH
jgi:hypothetical protein